LRRYRYLAKKTINVVGHVALLFMSTPL